MQTYQNAKTIDNKAATRCSFLTSPYAKPTFALLSKSYRRGFTLIELLMCIAIFSVSLTVIGPNISQWIVKQNVISQTNELSALLRSARHRAIDHQDTVTICPSQDFVECSDNWNHALIAFVDVNTNLMKDDEERLLFVGQKVNRQVYITGPTHPIRFLDSGANSSPATLKLCPVNSDERLAKAIVVSLQGRVRVTKDSNNDGVDEIRPRTDINCL